MSSPGSTAVRRIPVQCVSEIIPRFLAISIHYLSRSPFQQLKETGNQVALPEALCSATMKKYTMNNVVC